MRRWAMHPYVWQDYPRTFLTVAVRTPEKASRSSSPVQMLWSPRTLYIEGPG